MPLGNPLLCSLAVENDDYVVPVPFEVTFDIMSTSGSLACINISIPQDSALEGDHEFTVQLSTLSPDVVTIGSPANVEVVIADDESKCVYIGMGCADNIYGKYLHVYVHRYICEYDKEVVEACLLQFKQNICYINGLIRL